MWVFLKKCGPTDRNIHAACLHALTPPTHTRHGMQKVRQKLQLALRQC